MAVTYEWVVETLDHYEGCGDDPDIIDTTPFETLKEARAYAEQCDDPSRIALRRDEGSETEGLTWRGYAYLPFAEGAHFETGTGFADGPPVPKRFLKEAA